MLRYSFDLQAEADLVDQAVTNILAGGMRTADIMQPGKAKVSTSVLSDAIIGELDKLSA
jgi:3-isopropylmalate dehydrogenase